MTRSRWWWLWLLLFLAGAAVLLWLWVVVDFPGRNRNDLTWCGQRFGFPDVYGRPENRDYVGSAVATWQWWPPGARCVFALPGGGHTQAYTPPQWRTWVQLAGIATVAVSGAALLTSGWLRLRRRRSPEFHRVN